MTELYEFELEHNFIRLFKLNTDIRENVEAKMKQIEEALKFDLKKVSRRRRNTK